MTWIRARQPQQKEERRQSILEAASGLLLQWPVDEISLGQISKVCGFAKSNIYRYFESKEEVFLSLYLLDTERWIRGWTAALSTLPLHPPAQSISDLVYDTYAEVPRLGELIPWVYLRLAPALSPDFADQFLELDKRQNDRFADAIQVVRPDLDPATAENLFRQIRAFLAGSTPMLGWEQRVRTGAEDRHKGPQDLGDAPAFTDRRIDWEAHSDHAVSEESLRFLRDGLRKICRETFS